MPKVKFLKSFKFSPDGIEVVEYPAGATEDVDDTCAAIACEHGYAETAKGSAKPSAGGRSGKAADAAASSQAIDGEGGAATGGDDAAAGQGA